MEIECDLKMEPESGIVVICPDDIGASRNDDEPDKPLSFTLYNLPEAEDVKVKTEVVEKTTVQSSNSKTHAIRSKWELPEPRQVTISLLKTDLNSPKLCPVEDLKLNASNAKAREKSIVSLGPYGGYILKAHAEAFFSCSEWVVCVMGANCQFSMFADSQTTMQEIAWKPEGSSFVFELKHCGHSILHILREIVVSSSMLEQSFGGSVVHVVKEEVDDDEDQMEADDAGEDEAGVDEDDEDWLPEDAVLEEIDPMDEDESDGDHMSVIKQDPDSPVKLEIETRRTKNLPLSTLENTPDLSFPVESESGEKTLENESTVASDSDHRKFACLHCDSSFKRKKYLKLRHRCEAMGSSDAKHAGWKEISISGNENFHCWVCEKIFDSRSDFDDHLSPEADIKCVAKKGNKRCSVCSEEFSCVRLWKEHLKTHKSDHPFICRFCVNSFSTKDKWEEHKALCPRYVLCDICAKYMRVDQIKSHQNSHNDDNIKDGEEDSSTKRKSASVSDIKSFACLHCDKRFKMKKSLKLHHRCEAMGSSVAKHAGWKQFSVSGIEKFHCWVCGRVFDSKSDFDSHLLPESGIECIAKPNSRAGKKECNVCAEEFPCVRLLKEHLKAHKGDYPFTCHSCVKSFKNDDRWEEHKVICPKYSLCDICAKYIRVDRMKSHQYHHDETKYFKCGLCGKCYPTLRALRMHKSQLHPGARPHSCKVCGKTFLTPANLNKHMKFHLKPVQCPLCSYRADFPSTLEKHMLVHTQEKKYACEYCDKKLGSKHMLKKHLMKHRGEKIWHTCRECGDQFESPYYLKRHMIGVHGEVPKFQCQVCGLLCVGAGNLETHMNTHTGERPHVCDVCGKAFKHPTAKNVHMKTHTGEKPFRCEICGKRFMFRGGIKRHLKTHMKSQKTHMKSQSTIETILQGFA